jgi:hypothetical protein
MKRAAGVNMVVAHHL